MNLQTYVHPETLDYTGEELRPHFLLTHLRLKGPALAAFVGACEVKTEALVDWEDRMVNDFIRAKSMLHFLGEFFGMTLREGVYLQRLFTTIVRDELESTTGMKIRRDGDDLYWISPTAGERKLTVSIVTACPVSQLFHFGLNVDSEGAPVAAAGLKELLPDAARDSSVVRALAERILSRFQGEYHSIEWACTKVRPVV